MKTKTELLTEQQTSSDLIAKVFAEAGDELNFEKVTSLTGTVAEKTKALNDEMAKAETLGAQIAEMEQLEAAKKANDELQVKIKTPVNAAPKNATLNNGFSDGTYQKDFTVPARAKGFSVKNCKDEKQAYGMGMWFISQFGEKDAEDTIKAKTWVNEHLNMKALAGQINASGGALVPTEFLAQLIDLKETYGVYRRNARVVAMNSDTMLIPRRNAHTTAYWVTENTAPTESAPTFNNVQLVTKKLASYLAIPMELVEDSAIAIGEWVMGDFAWDFSYSEDLAAFIGDGTPTYGGIIGFTNALTNLSNTIANIAGLRVATGTGYATNYDSIVLTDLEAVVGKLPAYAVPRAKWYMSQSFYWNVAKKLENAAGGNTNITISEGVRNNMFLGFPVEVAQVMPTNSAVNQVCCLFGDVQLASILGDRRQFQVKTSDQAGNLWLNDQLGIKATQRLDINVHDVGNASATAGLRVPGPVVGLITAAS